MNSSSLKNITFVGLPTSWACFAFLAMSGQREEWGWSQSTASFLESYFKNQRSQYHLQKKKMILVYALLLLHEPVDMNFLSWPGLYHSSCSPVKFPSDSQSKLGEKNFEVCQHPAFSSCWKEVLCRTSVSANHGLGNPWWQRALNETLQVTV